MQKIHRYLGLVLSGFILVISVTGVMLVWKREYLWVTIPAARELPSPNNVLPLAAAKIKSTYAPNEVIFVRFYAERLSIHKVFLTERRYAWHDQNGEQLEVWSANERFEDWLLDLHHRLLLGNTTGLNLVGMNGLLLVFIMLLGLVLWWPWRHNYRANLVPKSGMHDHIRKSHAETGVSVILPALLIVVTGVILVYPTESRMLLRDGFSKPVPPVTQVLELPENTPFVDWQNAVEMVHQQFPGGKIQWLSYPREGSKAFTFGVQALGSWNRMGSSSVKFSDESTLIIKRQTEQTTINQALDYMYPLHGGKLPTLIDLP